MFYPSDERARTPACYEAISKEVKGLLDRGFFKAVKRNDVPLNANLLSTHVVLAVKDICTPNEKYKALVAAHGHKERDKDNLVHNLPSVRPISPRIVRTSAGIKRYLIWATDIVQAFIQSFDLHREIYLIPSP